MTTAWVVYSLLVGVLVSGAALGAESVLRLTGRPVRLVWGAALALTVALVAIAPGRAVPPAPGLAMMDRGTVPVVEVPVSAAPSGRGGRSSTLWVGAESLLRERLALAESRAPEGLGGWLGMGWAASSLLALAALLATHVRYRRLRRGWPVAEMDGLRVRVAPATGPAVLGMHRPEIVLPRWLLDLPAEERRLVLAHEQEHVRARDPLLLAAGCAAAALLPWHPASWWMLSRLRLAVEYDCDARVLRRGLDRRSYGTLLIDLAGRSSAQSFGLLALADDPSHLERRLIAMTSPRTRFAAARALAAGTLSALALVVACEAKLPTADEVARMDVSGVEALAGSLSRGGEIIYLVDGKEVTAEQARAVDPRAIEGLSLRTGQDADKNMVVMITSRERREALKAEVAAGIEHAVTGDALVLIDGKRADLAAYRALTPGSIQFIAVTKDPKEAVARYGPAAAGGVVMVSTKGGAQGRIGSDGIARLDGRPVARAEILEVLGRAKTPPTVYLIDGARGDRARLLALPEGEVWSIMIARDPAFAELYGPGAAEGIVQVKTKSGSAEQYERFVQLSRS